MQQATKWAVGASTPTALNDQEPSYNPDRGYILLVFRLIGVSVLCLIAGGFVQREDFAPAFGLIAVALLLATAEQLAAYFRYLNRLRVAHDKALNGVRPRGEFTGDGVPRDQGGRPFEPLSWEGVQV